MKTIRDYAAVSARLEETVSSLPLGATNAAELFDRYEEVAILVLDSEFGNYPTGALESYLKEFLHNKEQSLGLVKGPHSRQQ